MADTPYNATIADRHDLHEGLFHVWIRPDSGVVPHFVPGQYVTIGALSEDGKMMTRSYSIGSSANQRDVLELFVVHVDDGDFTTWLYEQRPGSRLWLSPSAEGTFTLVGVRPRSTVVLVSTGTGIAPFVSMYRTYHDDPPWGSVVIVNGVRYARDLGYREELEAAASADPTLSYLPTVTREPADSDWDGLRGRVAGVLEPDRFEQLTGNRLTPDQAHVFLCGNPGMVDATEATLAKRGFQVHSVESPGSLHVEKYW